MRASTTMNLGACVGLKETLAANRFTGPGADHYPLNEFIGKNFFDGDNYRAALERLDGGYEVAMDLAEWMQDYCDNEKDYAHRLLAYSEKWNTRIKRQSSLASYHTTKRAQLDVIRIARDVANLKETNCLEMQKVIDKYRNYINEIYITERFRPGRRHRRTNEFKKSFKIAYGTLRQVNDELDTLHTQEKRARQALHNAKAACEILDLDPQVSEKQRACANDLQKKRRVSLEEIEKKIDQTKEEQRSAMKTYRSEAADIFLQCQYVEEERLDQTRETLLDFIQAMYPANYSTGLNQIFENVMTKVTNHQDSFNDLLFWAKTYGIDNKLTKSFKATITETDEENEQEETSRPVETRPKKKSTNLDRSKHSTPVDDHEREDEDESSTPIQNNSTLTKTKTKRTKNAAVTPKKTSTHVESSGHPHSNGLDRV